MRLFRKDPDLRTRLRRAFNLLLVVILLLGVAEVGSRMIGLRTVNMLVDEVQPLIESNTRLMRVMADADSAQRGYRLTGDEHFLRQLNQSLEELPRVSRHLLGLSSGRPEIRRRMDTQMAAAETWVNDFALPLIERIRTDPAFTASPALLERGRSLFDAVRSANQRALEALTDIAQELEQDVRQSTIAAGLGTAVVLLVALGAGEVIARRTTASIATPLEDLRRTITRLAAGDLGARADLVGPPETRSVAAAVNQLAEVAQRSQTMQDAAISRMQELDQARADFVSSVSHELRTPLTSVTGYSEMLLDGDAGDLTDQQSKMVTTIERNARRLLALVEDILTVARLEAGEHRMASEPVDIAGLVQSAAEAVRPSVMARALDLDIDAPPQLGTIRGDQHQLERVLLNLLSNAVKFTPKGGCISVGVARHHDEVTIVVSDTGLGIPLAEQARMFERFFRSSISRDEVIPGTGLGLTIVKSIVEAHGGSIDFHSTPGRGTTFTVALPVTGQRSKTSQTVSE